MDAKNLLGAPDTGAQPTLLPEESDVTAEIEDGVDAYDIVRRHPESSLAWSLIADHAWVAVGIRLLRLRTGGLPPRVGRPASQRLAGSGPVPATHAGNLGFLRCLAALARAADAIGEEAEAQRCTQFLADCGGLGN